MADLQPDGPIVHPDGSIVPDGPIQPPEQHGNFARGVLSGVAGLKTAGGGLAELAGDKLNLPSLSEWGRGVAQVGQERQAELAAPTDTLTNIHSISDAGAYTAHVLGQALPTLAQFAGQTIAGTALAGPVGGVAANVAGFGAAGAGNIYDEAKAQNLTNPGTRAVLGGLAQGATMAIAPEALMAPVAGSVVKSVAKQAAIQGTIGAVQPEIERAALGQPLTGSDATQAAIEAAVPMAFLGGGLGGLHARLEATKQARLKTAQDSAAADVAAGEPTGAPPALPSPGITVGSEVPYSAAPGAELRADQQATQRDAARQNEEARLQLMQAHGEIVDELQKAGITPAQALSFPDFVAQMREEARKQGVVLSQQHFQELFEHHQQEVVAENIQRGQALETARTPAPIEGDMQIPVDQPGGQVPEPTAMALALDRATKNRQIDEAYRGRQLAEVAGKEKDLNAIQNVSRGAEEARKAAAGELIEGGVLPWKVQELSTRLDALKEDGQGMPPRLKQELAGAVKDAKSEEAQLTAIANLRNNKKPNSASFELLSKLHDQLSEGKENAIPVESTGGILPREQGQAAEAGGERGRVGQGEQGNEAAGQGQPPADEKGRTNGEGNAQAAEAVKSKGGRPAGVTDDRHTLAPPTAADDLYPYKMTRDQAAKGPGGIFTEKAWWEDLAWAVAHPDTKPGKELLENGKFTDEQMAQAPAKAERYARQDALLREFRGNIEAKQKAEAETGLEQDIAAIEKSRKALTTKEMMDIIDEWDPEGLSKETQSQEEIGADNTIIKTLQNSSRVTDVLDAVATVAGSHLKPIIAALRTLDLKTDIGYFPGVLRELDGSTTLGRYSPSRDTILIGRGGASPEVVLHELTHAATVTELWRSAQLLDQLRDPKGQLDWSDLTKSQQVKVEAAHELTQVLEDARLEAAKQGIDLYGLKDITEFLAEAWSSPNFQEFLKGASLDRQPGLWDRFVSFVKNLLGIQGPKNMLERALDAGVNFFSDEAYKSGDAQVLNKVAEDFNGADPKKAVDAPDSMLGALKNIAQSAADKLPAFHGIDLVAFKSLLGWQTVGYMQQRTEATPGLSKLVAPFKVLQEAYNTHRQVAQHLEDQAAPYARKVELMLHGIKDGDARRKLSLDMMTLAGEGSRLGVNFADDYATNLKRDPELKGIDKPYFEKLRRQYMALPADIRGMLKDGEDINRTLHTQGMAARVAAIINAGVGPELRERMPLLDFMQKKNAELGKNLRETFTAAKTLPEDNILRSQLGELEKIYKVQTENPYYHLGRNGDYFVRLGFKDMDAATYAKLEKALAGSNKVLGDVASLKEHGAFFRVDTADQAQGLYRKLIEASGDKIAEGKIAQGLLASSDKLDNAAGLNNAMRSILQTLQDSVGNDPTLTPEQSQQLKNNVTRQFLSMLPETSSRKAQMQRSGVPGYDGDFLRNFSTRASGAVHDVTHTYTAQKFTAAFKDFRDAIQGEGGLNTAPEGDSNVRAQMIHDELSRRYINGMTPIKADAVNIINSLGHSFYLALSPAFLIRTTMQPFHRGLPILGSRFGFVKGGTEIAKATKASIQIITDSVRAGFSEGGVRGVLDTGLQLDNAGLTPKDRAFVQEMHDRGELNIGQSHQLARMATGADVRTSDLTRFASMTAQYAEMTNRLVVGLAAYRLSGDVEYSLRASRNAMDTFEPDQTARQIGKHGFAGKVTPLMTSFMNYNLQTMQQVARTVHDGMFNKDQSPAGLQRSTEAKKEFAGLMATTMTLSGALGLPFVNVFAGLYNWATKDEDDPSDVRADVRNFMADFMGKDAAEMLAHGPSRALGVDLQTTGLQNLLPGTEFLDNRRLLKDRLESQSQQLLGPALNAGIDVGLAVSKMSDGYYTKGVEQALPSGLKAYYKAAELATTGYTDSKGNPVPISATPWEVLVQATGFSPAKKAERTEASLIFSTNEELLQHRKQVISDQVFKAVSAGDTERTDEAIAEMRRFNATNPLEAVRDIGAVFRAHAIQMATGQLSGTGVGVTTGRKMPKLEDIRFANTQTGGMP